MTRPGAHLLAEGVDSAPVRLRIRYRDAATPSFDLFYVSPEELPRVLDGTGWHLLETLSDEGSYVGIIGR